MYACPPSPPPRPSFLIGANASVPFTKDSWEGIFACHNFKHFMTWWSHAMTSCFVYALQRLKPEQSDFESWWSNHFF